MLCLAHSHTARPVAVLDLRHEHHRRLEGSTGSRADRPRAQTRVPKVPGALGHASMVAPDSHLLIPEMVGGSEEDAFRKSSRFPNAAPGAH